MENALKIILVYDHNINANVFLITVFHVLMDNLITIIHVRIHVHRERMDLMEFVLNVI